MSNKNLSTGKETVFYTIVGKPDGRIYLTYKDRWSPVGGYDGIPAKPVELQMVHGNSCYTLPVMIQPQQLMELGALFLALAGTVGIDFDSADALLEGYGLKGKEAATMLAKALEE